MATGRIDHWYDETGLALNTGAHSTTYRRGSRQRSIVNAEALQRLLQGRLAHRAHALGVVGDGKRVDDPIQVATKDNRNV